MEVSGCFLGVGGWWHVRARAVERAVPGVDDLAFAGRATRNNISSHLLYFPSIDIVEGKSYQNCGNPAIPSSESCTFTSSLAAFLTAAACTLPLALPCEWE